MACRFHPAVKPLLALIHYILPLILITVIYITVSAGTMQVLTVVITAKFSRIASDETPERVTEITGICRTIIHRIMKRYFTDGLPTAIALDWHARQKAPASQQLALETKLRLWFAPTVDKTLRMFSTSHRFAVFTPKEGVVRVYDRHDHPDKV